MGDENNNINNNNNPNDDLAQLLAQPPLPLIARAAAIDDDEDNLPIAVELPRHPNHRNRRLHRFARATAAVVADVGSNVLLRLLQEGVHCKDELLLSEGGCQRIVDRCRDHPDEVNFICRHTGRTPLHEAALRCSCIHVVQALVQADHEVFLFDRWANTPLHLLFQGIASRQLSPERIHPIVDELLRTSPSMIPCSTNLEGYTPLHVACTGSETMIPPSTIERLLEANSTCASKQSRRGECPLHLHCNRRGASLTIARLLIEAYPAGLRAVDGTDKGWTPLHYACSRLNTDLILTLIEADTFPVRQRSVSGETPLHVFCRQRPTDQNNSALRALLEHSSEVVGWRDTRRGHTCLHSLCGYQHVSPEVVELVLEYAPSAVRVTDELQNLPLHQACEAGVTEKVIHMLIKADPSTAKARTRKNDTPLSLACSTNRSAETVQILLEQYPEATMIANDYGYLPLHCSVRSYQPSRSIVAALTEAAPTSLVYATNGGEAAIHLVGNNNSASTTIINDMNRALKDMSPESALLRRTPAGLKTKVGNTPLHYACFRGANREQIESLAINNPEWLSAQNSAGFTPLQILSKSGRIDADLVTLFSRLGGPGLFSMTDSMGNTPLHSAIRTETSLGALQALIRACPRVLLMKTIYDDTPLHLACLRRVDASVVHEVALASCEGLEVSLANCDQRISPILWQNTAGQTPVSIAMEEYQKSFAQMPQNCSVKMELSGDKKRAFKVLATLAKMLHYGPVSSEEAEYQNLVLACVCLHRKNVRLNPTFIRRAILTAPEEVSECDEDGNYPLHFEAGIPIEKMSLLDGPGMGCCGGSCAQRSGVLRLLLDIYPEAAKQRNSNGDFPLGLMIQNGRRWDTTFSLILRTHPQAIHWVDGVTQVLVPSILSRVTRECGNETVMSLLKSRPDLVIADPKDRASTAIRSSRQSDAPGGQSSSEGDSLISENSTSLKEIGPANHELLRSKDSARCMAGGCDLL